MSMRAIAPVLALALCFPACDSLISPIENELLNEVYVWGSGHFNVYQLDPDSYELSRTINLPFPTLNIRKITFSRDRDFLVFNGYRDDSLIFLHYDLDLDSLHQPYTIDLSPIGCPDLFPGDDPARPGLIYAYENDLGLYAVDFLTHEVVEVVSSEQGYTLRKTIKYSPERKRAGIRVYDTGTTEIEIYPAGTRLAEPLTVLNENNADSIYIYDFVLGDYGHEVYLTYRNIRQGSDEGLLLVGEYDVSSRNLICYDIAIRSTDPEAPVFSSRRDEMYFMLTGGEYGVVFCIVDTYTRQLADTLSIEGMTGGRGELGLVNNDSFALVAGGYNEIVAVIDLRKREHKQNIALPDPYYILIRKF